ncbi:MAG: TIGR03986 family type III CRISPR-associated RAMP protein, partial [Thiomonas sp.]
MPVQPQRYGSNTARPHGQPGGASGQQSAQGSKISAISAPYNFVPLSDQIFLPDWAQAVSHDVPFQDGYCGELHYTLTAHTPLLVGGRQQESTGTQPGEVTPFQLPDGTYAIPGSSLKGMLRNVLEIAAFGRMSKVDEVRPGLRDISKADSVYAQRVRGKVQTGFLKRLGDGSNQIIPCAMLRLNHRNLEEALNLDKPIFSAGKNVHDKYVRWEQLCRQRGIDPKTIRFERGQPDATRLFQGSLSGMPVFTGQISDSTKRGGKYRDFVFFDAKVEQAFAVPKKAWQDFLRIHGDEDGKPDMSWPGHWRKKYRSGEQIPVFYLRDGDQLRIGLAYMPKLAGDFSTHDLICHVNPDHLNPPGEKQGYDLADLLFGAINGERQADALRGRVSIETALAVGKPTPQPQLPTILNSPKPSYFPNYITQQAHPATWKLKSGQQYATYISTTGSRAPTLRGFKRYPVRAEGVEVQALTGGQQNNTRVQVRLHPLPANTRFRGRIVFHNLKPAELGALLWALTWGANTTLRHSLGMGKPFGFGQVGIDIDLQRSRLLPNDPAQPEAPLSAETQAQFIQQFCAQMRAAIPGWETSAQLRNLLAMADPAAAQKWKEGGRELRHMRLDAASTANGAASSGNQF